ncbi:hypothetical protein ILYODFUR_008946 [Ilyodon furcidens]|uniref:Uncharacterized protein n=1 Tax=Ilyodon furcidens TaxID=33524 RepID=A0ABV0UEI7_9TELE
MSCTTLTYFSATPDFLIQYHSSSLGYPVIWHVQIYTDLHCSSLISFSIPTPVLLHSTTKAPYQLSFHKTLNTTLPVSLIALAVAVQSSGSYPETVSTDVILQITSSAQDVIHLCAPTSTLVSHPVFLYLLEELFTTVIFILFAKSTTIFTRSVFYITSFNSLQKFTFSFNSHPICEA